jgi:hypothetical protein
MVAVVKTAGRLSLLAAIVVALGLLEPQLLASASASGLAMIRILSYQIVVRWAKSFLLTKKWCRSEAQVR